MNKFLQTASNNFDSYFSPSIIKKVELILLRLAIISFIVHLLIIYFCNNFECFKYSHHSYLKAIYTPFSFILFYEVFLLIIIIPNSISEFVGKQFEVITLITLRSFFHDIADFELNNIINFQNQAFISMVLDLSASILMLGLTIVYYKVFHIVEYRDIIVDLDKFINIKKTVSFCMIIVLLILSLTSFLNWCLDMLKAINGNSNFPNPNNVFYNDFFSIMIFVDVFLLIISFTFQSSFLIIFRNASFIITTILIRMSLSISKPMNYIVIIFGFLFSILSFYLYKRGNNFITNDKSL